MSSGNSMADQGEKEYNREGKCHACGSHHLEEIEFCNELADECLWDKCDVPKSICPGPKTSDRCLECGYINKA